MDLTLRAERPSLPVAFLAAWLVVYTVGAVVLQDPAAPSPLLADLMYMPFRMTLTLVLWQAARRSSDARIARAWLLLTAAQCFAVIGNASWVVTDLTGVATSNAAYLSWTLPQSALTLAGFVAMIRRADERHRRAGDWLDAAVLVIAAATIAWYFIAARLVSAGYDDQAGLWLFFVDSTTNAATLLLAIMAWLRPPHGLAPGAMPRIATALFMIAAADLVLEALLARGAYRSGSVIDVWYGTAILLYALGADAQRRLQAGTPAPDPRPDRADTIVMGAIALSLVPLVVEIWKSDIRTSAFAASGVGVVVLLLLALWRQRLARLEIEHLMSTRLQIEQQLWQAQKLDAIGRMAGGIAHDFNNVLTAIGSHAQRLRDGEHTTVAGEAAEIQFAADRAAALVRRLLAFSRAGTTEHRSVVLGDAVRAMERMVRQLARRDITLTFDIDDDRATVSLADGQLEQMLLNLVINAQDATPPGGQVSITTRRSTVPAGKIPQRNSAPPGEWAVLEVSDTGRGMDAATQASAFQPFFTTRGDSGGTGLGLATVAGIVHSGGGHVFVESAVGAGTTMTIYLPLARGDDAALARGVPPAVPQTILIVDHERPIRAALARYLASRGYHVLEAADAAQAQAQLESQNWAVDLVLTDVQLAGGTGMQLAARARERRPDLPILFMTGFGDVAAAGETAAPPRDDTIAKPFDLRMVADRVRTKLASASR